MTWNRSISGAVGALDVVRPTTFVGAAVIHVEVTQSVNDPAQADQYALAGNELWAGLRSKAENAVPFGAGMSEGTVLEREGAGLVGEGAVTGQRIREDATFV